MRKTVTEIWLVLEHDDCTGEAKATRAFKNRDEAIDVYTTDPNVVGFYSVNLYE